MTSPKTLKGRSTNGRPQTPPRTRGTSSSLDTSQYPGLCPIPVQAIVSDRKQGPPIAQGRGQCDKCGAGLHVLGEEFSAFVASIGGDPAATGVAEGLELGGGYVLTVAQPGGGYHCPKCGHPGVFTPLKLH